MATAPRRHHAPHLVSAVGIHSLHHHHLDGLILSSDLLKLSASMLKDIVTERFGRAPQREQELWLQWGAEAISGQQTCASSASENLQPTLTPRKRKREDTEETDQVQGEGLEDTLSQEKGEAASSVRLNVSSSTKRFDELLRRQKIELKTLKTSHQEKVKELTKANKKETQSLKKQHKNIIKEMRKQMKMEPCTLCRGTGPSTMCQCEMTLMLRHKGNAKMDCS